MVAVICMVHFELKEEDKERKRKKLVKEKAFKNAILQH